MSQKWSFKSEPVWKDFGVGGILVNLIPYWNRRLVWKKGGHFGHIAAEKERDEPAENCQEAGLESEHGKEVPGESGAVSEPRGDKETGKSS